MKHTKIDGHPDLIRDVETNAILNNNKNEYEKYLLTTQIKKTQQSKVEKIEEIHSLLKAIISNISVV
jgi:hypothetical protein